MKHLIALFLKYQLWLLAFLKPLGFWGVGIIALIDSSSVPLPMDLIIAGYAWSDRRHFYIYPIMAALGSAIGGLVPFLLGRAGGEIFLLKRIERKRYEQLRDKFEHQEFLALLVPSMLPPPTPWKLFVFAAGVFEMRTLNFVIAVFLGRLVRFGVEALLTIRYGPHILDVVGNAAKRHMDLVLTAVGIFLGVIVLWAVRKSRSKP